jgi:hypothetical protein
VGSAVPMVPMGGRVDPTLPATASAGGSAGRAAVHNFAAIVLAAVRAMYKPTGFYARLCRLQDQCPRNRKCVSAVYRVTGHLQ